jgi:hypothetical protein
MPAKRFIASLIILGISTILALPPVGSQAQSVPAGGTVERLSDAGMCQDILTRAMNTVQSTCDGLGRNKACYGNNKVTVEPNDGASLKFDAIGDRASIQDIRRLVTSPLDTTAGTWGLSLLKLQANLPDSLPGQNITFLVFGNTAVENTSGDMSAFYFTTGLGSLDCKEAPRDGILVRSPQHTEVTFTANGLQISIASTVMLRAVRNQSMSVELIEGHARLTTPAGSQTLQPGEVSSVTLGGPNGLTATSAPSAPEKASPDPSLDPVVTTAGLIGDPDAAVNVSLDGCITATDGNTVTVNDYTINVGSDRVLKDAKVGDCIHVEGQIKANIGKGRDFILIKASRPNRFNAGDNGHKGNSRKGNAKDKGGNKGGNSDNANKGGNDGGGGGKK